MENTKEIKQPHIEKITSSKVRPLDENAEYVAVNMNEYVELVTKVNELTDRVNWLIDYCDAMKTTIFDLAVLFKLENEE